MLFFTEIGGYARHAVVQLLLFVTGEKRSNCSDAVHSQGLGNDGITSLSIKMFWQKAE